MLSTLPPGGADVVRAGVVGSPIGHSLSPRLHRAAYAELGLRGWTYDALDVPAGELARFVASLGPEWVGLSVTMPGKEEALALAADVSHEARLTGAANTLVRSRGSWSAYNTDVDGIVEALRAQGVHSAERSTVIGGGATARSALVALRALGAREVTLVVRDRLRTPTHELAQTLGLEVTVRRLADGAIGLGRETGDVVVSTLPGSASAPDVAITGGGAPYVLDVVYAPWPSPLALAVEALGPQAPTVIPGTEMLLHQAARQVRLMTGHDVPVEAMRAALPVEGSAR